jgi:hypothetical protein
VVAVACVVPGSLLVSVVRRVTRETVDCCLEQSVRLRICLGPPRVERADRFDAASCESAPSSSIQLE